MFSKNISKLIITSNFVFHFHWTHFFLHLEYPRESVSRKHFSFILKRFLINSCYKTRWWRRRRYAWRRFFNLCSQQQNRPYGVVDPFKLLSFFFLFFFSSSFFSCSQIKKTHSALFYVSLMHETIRNGKRHFFIYISPEERRGRKKERRRSEGSRNLCKVLGCKIFFIIFT